jgi:Rrf2 family transcriptional regulator, nitric oxide-sensitive transcriptional repressor
MISRTAEYALRAVVYLAAGVNIGRPSQTVGEIATATRVPADYLAKVLGSLSRSGLITSQRGLGGGYRLARAADKISIYEVIQAVDPLQRIRECPLGLEEHVRLCPLHKRLDDAMALIEEQFRATTIAELLRDSQTASQQASDHSAAHQDPCVFPLRTASGP